MTVATHTMGSESAGADDVVDGTLRVTELRKAFTERNGSGNLVYAVDGVSFEVASGSLFTLLGPSGCGKTTTLRSVAGLETPDSGSIQVGSRRLFSGADYVNVSPERRNLGMVFQSYAIWPHMSVYKNAALPLLSGRRGRGLSRAQIRPRVGEVLHAVQLGHLHDWPATDLSGGQQQRLALARALVLRPPLLLLDEPLSNLDAKLREDMRLELKALQRSLGITALYVTHDQVEALAMSTIVAVMNGGKIEQMGRPKQIYENPASYFVADFIGSCNFLPATVVSVVGNGEFKVRAGDTELIATSDHEWKAGDEALIAVRPENVQVADVTPEGAAALNAVEAVVEARAYLGEAREHLVVVGDDKLRSRGHVSNSFAPGTNVLLQFMKGSCRLLPPDPAFEAKKGMTLNVPHSEDD